MHMFNVIPHIGRETFYITEFVISVTLDVLLNFNGDV